MSDRVIQWQVRVDFGGLVLMRDRRTVNYKTIKAHLRSHMYTKNAIHLELTGSKDVTTDYFYRASNRYGKSL